MEKADILFKLTADSIELSMKNDGEQLLKGLLHSRVDVKASTWTIMDRKWVHVEFLRTPSQTEVECMNMYRRIAPYEHSGQANTSLEWMILYSPKQFSY